MPPPLFDRQSYSDHPAEADGDDNITYRALRRAQWRRDAQNPVATLALRQSDAALKVFLATYPIQAWAVANNMTTAFLQEHSIYFTCWALCDNPVEDQPTQQWTNAIVDAILDQTYQREGDFWYSDMEAPKMKSWVGQACPTQLVGVFGRDPNAEVPDEELGETTTAGQKRCRVGLPVLLLMSFATCTPKMPLVAWNFQCGKNRHYKSKSDASLINREDLAKAMGAMMVVWDKYEIDDAPIRNQALLRFYFRRALWETQYSTEEIAKENTKDKRNVLCDNLDELRIRNARGPLATSQAQVTTLTALVAQHVATIAQRDTTITNQNALLAQNQPQQLQAQVANLTLQNAVQAATINNQIGTINATNTTLARYAATNHNLQQIVQLCNDIITQLGAERDQALGERDQARDDERRAPVVITASPPTVVL